MVVDTKVIEQQGFHLIQQIEETLQTDIWKARQVALNRTVCLQILKPEFARSRVDCERFLGIARCFAKLKSESIASVFDIVSVGDLHYVVMEYVDGPTLEETVAGQKPLPLKQMLQIASSLAFGLEQLWDSAHIVHRNLKGATVRLDPRGVAKITDLSLAFVARPGVDMVELDGGHIVGAPSFISPEYAQGQATLTTQSDMYAFGALLYNLATGHAPFDTLDVVEILEGQVRAQIQPPHQLNSQVPVAFSWFVHRLMMKNPANRYADWRAVRHDIKCLLNGLEPHCVRPDETFLSTILVQPMLDAMTAAEPDETAAQKSIRLTQKGRHNAQWEKEHNRDILLGNIRTALFMSLLLLGWFALLFWYRGIYQPSRQTPETLEPTRNDRGDSVMPDAPPEPPPVAVEPAPAVAEPPLAVVTPPTPPPAATNTPPIPEPKKIVEMPKALRDALITAFKAGDIAAAQRHLADNETPFTTSDAVQGVLAAAPTVTKIVEAGVRANIGRTLSVMYKDKVRDMIPRSITNGIISVEVHSSTHELVIAELGTDTKLAFVADPKTEAEHLTYCLMLLESSRKNDVPKFAAKCPALRDLILAAGR